MVREIFNLCFVSPISRPNIAFFSACSRAGKCMDFVHEDLSLMSQEMDRWRALRKVKVSREDAPSMYELFTSSPESRWHRGPAGALGRLAGCATLTRTLGRIWLATKRTNRAVGGVEMFFFRRAGARRRTAEATTPTTSVGYRLKNFRRGVGAY